MAKDVRDVLTNLKEITMTDSAISTLLDFERVIDELDIYTFPNWKRGELVQGPKYEKYFITCTFMWPIDKKPDVRGASRLNEYDIILNYSKDFLEIPVKVKNQNDFKPGTKFPKTKKIPVWLVEIIMPKTLMAEIQRGSIELETASVEAEDVELSSEKGVQDSMYTTDSAAPVAAAQGEIGNV